MTSRMTPSAASERQKSFPARNLLLPLVLVASFAASIPARAETQLLEPPLKSIVPPTAASPPCAVHAEMARFAYPLSHVGARLAADLPVKIVAIGSSSTAGAGATSAAASYPNRLAVELARRFQTEDITVVNQGVNGEEAADMLARFDAALAEHPDLVLWQVGTNAVLHDTSSDAVAEVVIEGIKRIKAIGADVVLIDPQFAPRVLAKGEAQDMVDRIAVVAKSQNVELFRRFAMMRHWREVEGMPFDSFVSPDGLHQNDWSYACLAKTLSAAIVEASSRPTATAAAHGAR